ncbi:hypothetical protein CVT25_010617 [Psilocybe cyanescens]|uniref:Transcription activator GCR1-like domain-containing protein n=1 Tax=Psilocybe cyanescens TaxID=93625 RepID=A0A409VWV2_PSICY|nr:hypothetical protein CVT25_010617 [Psilocybe cyanescens]
MSNSDFSESETSEYIEPLQMSGPTRRRLNSTVKKDHPPKRKRTRVDNSTILLASVDEPEVRDVDFPGELTLLEESPAPQATSSSKNTSKTSILPPSLSPIKARAHLNRLALQADMDRGKGTESAYPRHVKSYLKFWEADQDELARDNPGYQRIDPHPITGEKVAIFLQYEFTRNKRTSRGNEKSGTSLGKDSIKQTISALQRYMKEHQHEPLYQNCPDTRISLRDQDWVKKFEEAASAREPQRIADAHTAKSKGTLADTYKTEELIRMSNWNLQAFGPAKTQTHLGIRDRLMLLLSTNAAFRGDSTRRILWSDLFTRNMPMPNMGPNVEIPAIIILADQAKTNSVGRIDQHGMFCHRHPELYFYILRKAPLNFTPDFSDTEHSEFGRRDWYGVHLFPGKTDGGSTPMTYENHRERVNNMHNRNDVSVSAVTHAARFYTADKASSYGALKLDVKALGNWKTGDAYSEIYDRTLPVSAMLASAMFNAQNQREYVLPRDHITYFRGLNQNRMHTMKGLRNAAVLFIKYPSCSVWSYAPFSAPDFRQFASSTTDILSNAEFEARRRLERLPETVALSMRGVLEGLELKQRQERDMLMGRLEFMEGLIINQNGCGRRKHTGSLILRGSPCPSTSEVLPCPAIATLVRSSGDHAEIGGHSSPIFLPAYDTEDMGTSSHDPNWPTDLLHLRSNFVLSEEIRDQNLQIGAIRELIIKFGSEQISCHQFEWIKSKTNSVSDEWLPFYKYDLNVRTLVDIWNEYTEGLHGNLSVRQLTERWGARWRRNNQGQKTEATRRKIITTLITKLSQKPNWTVDLALRFLNERYPIPSSTPKYLNNPRAFITHLQNTKTGKGSEEAITAIVSEASNFC